MKKKILVLFDQIVVHQGGGVNSVYSQLVPLWQQDYEVEIVSVFDPGVDEFFGVPIKHLISYQSDIDLRKAKENLMAGNIAQAMKVPVSIWSYLTKRKTAAQKLASMIQDKILIAVSPAAATFVPENVPFILEIHSSYDYFFQSSALGKVQTRMMQRPALTLFRTKADFQKAEKELHPWYVYNFSSLTPKKADLEVHKPFSIFYAGRFDPLKNPMRALRCALQLKNIGAGFHLDLYGDGSLRHEMEKFVKENHLEEEVTFKGYVNDQNFYAGHDVMWCTSDVEGFGMAIIEAKAFGIPSISTRWGEGVKEVISQGEDGFIADGEDQLVSRTLNLMNNPALLSKMKQNASRSFSRFNADQARKEWAGIFDAFEQKDCDRFSASDSFSV
ncbi:MAG: glycosyltransferase [Ileibacterium sp.]|nr:glycosyltransferase [Ileibacterium sp.]